MSGTVVRLAGRDFAIRPLTLGQLRVVLDVVAGLPGKTGGELVDPATPLDTGLALEASRDEVNAAVASILQTAGLAPSGEAVPAATAAPSSPASTAPSRPGAATPFP